MSKLDDKLKEILSEYAPLDEYNDDNLDYMPEYVAQIKQAFADELYNMLDDPQFKVGLLKAAREDGLMTGAEWYDRWKAHARKTELYALPLWHDLDEAAKKAAGL